VKLALISEVHANLEALTATLDDIAQQRADRIACLGDIVGYNTDPSECIALLRKVGALCVAGNHDRAVCGQITTETFSKTAARAAAWTHRRLTSADFEFLSELPSKAEIAGGVIAVHGALHPQTGCESVRLDTDERRARSFAALMAHPSGARICAFGHTHQLAVYELRDGEAAPRTGDDVALRDDAYYLINPGSVGAPPVTDPRATYMLLDLAHRTVAVRRVAYDTAAVLAKTRAAGLAPLRSYLPPSIRYAMRRGWHAMRPAGASQTPSAPARSPANGRTR
jgi:predicted phosphodiesterase